MKFLSIFLVFLVVAQQSQAAPIPCTPAELEALLGALKHLYQQYRDALANRPTVAPPTEAPTDAPNTGPTDAPTAAPTAATAAAPAKPPGFFRQLVDNGIKFAEEVADAADNRKNH